LNNNEKYGGTGTIFENIEYEYVTNKSFEKYLSKKRNISNLVIGSIYYIDFVPFYKTQNIDNTIKCINIYNFKYFINKFKIIMDEINKYEKKERETIEISKQVKTSYIIYNFAYNGGLDNGDPKYEITNMNKNVQNVFKTNEYELVANKISKYLETKNNIKVSMPPLIIINSGPPGIGKSMFLDYIVKNYNLRASRFIINYSNLETKQLSDIFTGILNVTNNCEYEINLINIDEFDKLYLTLKNKKDKNMENFHDYFMDQLFAFINQLKDGMILVLTMNNENIFFPQSEAKLNEQKERGQSEAKLDEQNDDIIYKKETDDRHKPLIDRMIFTKFNYYDINNVKDYLNFYNNQLKETSLYMKPNDINIILQNIDKNIIISARELSQLLLLNNCNYEKIISEINKKNLKLNKRRN
jgi:hypothetical protein